jgi:hypothetical protein
VAGAAADPPCHPAHGRRRERRLHFRPAGHAVEHIVGEVPAVPAVEEGADRIGLGVGHLGDRGEGARPSLDGLRAH